MKTVQAAARELIKDKLPEIRSYIKSRTSFDAPTVRRAPTTIDVWKKYCAAMITSQTRDTPELWAGLRADERWMQLRAAGPSLCPNERSLARLLGDHPIRFPSQKARRLRRAADRDFEGLADLLRSGLRETHDRRQRREAMRREEVRLACALQEELGGCGVAPKIARLILVLLTEFHHVIPVDSRWQGALEGAGASVPAGAFARESSYVLIEEQIARASYELGVLPAVADGAIFGWIDPAYQEATG
jgi:hypothetical protein